MNKEKRKTSGYWDDKKKCSEAAVLCSSRSEFIKKYPTAYSSSLKNGWIDEICSHMEVLGNLFQRCIYAFEFPDDYVYVGLTDNFGRREKQHLSSPISPVYLCL